MDVDVTEFMAQWGNSLFDLCHGDGAWKLAIEASESLQGSPTYGKALISELRAHFAEFGAWTRAEIAEFTEVELLAMLAQDIAADACENRAYVESALAHGDWRREGSEGRLQCYAETWTFYVGI